MKSLLLATLLLTQAPPIDGEDTLGVPFDSVENVTVYVQDVIIPAGRQDVEVAVSADLFHHNHAFPDPACPWMFATGTLSATVTRNDNNLVVHNGYVGTWSMGPWQNHIFLTREIPTAYYEHGVYTVHLWTDWEYWTSREPDDEGTGTTSTTWLLFVQ